MVIPINEGYCFTDSGIFLPFCSWGDGPVEFGEKKHLGDQIGKTRTGPPF